MRYFHCPKTYRSKPYGCGAGPYNGTEAMLDRWGKCYCGKALVPFKRPKPAKPQTMKRCEVRDYIGQLYCWQPAVAEAPSGAAYCRRHSYLAV